MSNNASLRKGGQLKNSILLLIAAIVWGISFVVQQKGGQTLGAYTFNGLRMLLGAFFVFLATFFLDKVDPSWKPVTKKEKKKLWIVGSLCGVFLFAATNLQQVALNTGVMPGKAGFITAIYILLVPIIGMLFGRKSSWNVWIGVAVAIVGLYFLCINGEIVLQSSDLLLLGCALGFAIQILIVDRFAPTMDGLRLSVIEFLVVGVLTLPMALIFEIIPYEGGFSSWIMQFATWEAWGPLLYMSVLSCGCGYTLQILGQQDLNPTIASLLMSLESVFSVIASLVFLSTSLSSRELIGCVLMFIAICLAQIKFPALSAKKDRKG